MFRVRSAGEVLSSIVIVNKDDVRVASTLEHLAPFVAPELSEIVVVDASNHRLDHLKDRFPVVRWIEYENPHGKARTIADQRNLGIAASVGDVVVFLDANCVPSPDWLERLIEPILHGNEDIVAGRITSMGRGSIRHRMSPQASVKSSYLEECANMNIAIRRTVFDHVGYFDESLGFAEDFDFAWRARNSGYRICFNPDAEVLHDFGDYREQLPRAFRYGVAKVRLYRKHTDRLDNLLRRDGYLIAYSAFILLSPIALVFPAYLLLLVYPIYRNRRFRPFRTVLYNLTYALGALSELFHVPILKGQRKPSCARSA